MEEFIQEENVAAWTRRKHQAYLWSLVLSSARIPHVIGYENTAWAVKVRPEQIEAARQEIILYEEENKSWPPARDARPQEHLAEAQPLVLVVMGALAILFGVTGPWAYEGEWFRQGAVSARAILEKGEWWRVVTGLTLHADAGHLFSNIVVGGVLAYYLCRLLGGGLGWLLILAAGIVGNAVNVVARGGDFRSVGYSTAVFGTIGILSGLKMVRGWTVKEALLAAGGAGGLLAFLGTAGERTDLGAHLWGLVAGFAIGFVIVNAPPFLKWASRTRNQITLRAIAIAIVFGAWWFALHT